MTCDGLDGADPDGDGPRFHAFAMGTLQGPAWLVPVARYAPAYARDIGRYALHAACSVRLLQGVGLDADHQDHKPWKDRWDPENLFFYEALVPWPWGDPRGPGPYATGDQVRRHLAARGIPLRRYQRSIWGTTSAFWAASWT